MSNLFWTKKECDIIIKYYANSPWELLLRLLPNRSVAGITMQASSLNITRRHYPRPNAWTAEEDAILIKEYANNSLLDTMKKKITNRSSWAIHERIKKLKLKHSARFMYSPNTTGDIRVLLKDNVVAYYWVGFLAADGHLGDNSMMLLVADKDHAHIKKYAKFVRARVVMLVRPNHRVYRYVRINHKLLINDLKVKFDFNNRKTYIPPSIEVFKTMPDELFMAYMIGFLDGDGCIVWNKKKMRYLIQVGCYNTWKDWLLMSFTRMAQILHVAVHVGVSYGTKDHKNCVKVYIASKEFMLLLKTYIIDNKITYLPRKFGKIIL